MKESGEGKENCNYNIKNKIKILSKKKQGRISLLRKEVPEIVDLNCPLDYVPRSLGR